ncbi:hypothetical protein GGI23_003877 [Coemansia sp. RSA 2559]|nr:hypothetical protein GGI23_003877 [Coemansia sp. RSA 2559]
MVLIATVAIAAAAGLTAAPTRADRAVDSDAACQASAIDRSDSEIKSQRPKEDHVDSDVKGQLPEEDQVDSNIDGVLCAREFDHYKLSKAQKDGVFYTSDTCPSVWRLGRFASSTTKKSFMPQISFAGDALSTISKGNIHRRMAEMEKAYKRAKVRSHISDDYVLYPKPNWPLVALDC